MSADSPSRARSKSGRGGGGETTVVFPQQVTDPTILDSVAGFINEVVPASYNIPVVVDSNKDQVQWAHFEELEDGGGGFAVGECEKTIPPPLILVLGYSTGVQVWALPANGEAVELFSWRHGSVQVLRLLPAPYKAGKSLVDLYESKRPLIALCDTVTPGPQYGSLSFLSLRTGEQVKQIKFRSPILDVLANHRSVVVTFLEKIAVFDAFTLEDRCTVTTCYISPGISGNPVALGTRWMAYAERNLIPLRRSSGGNEGEGVQSYTATVLHAAKSLGRGLRELGETVASSLTGTSPYKPSGSPQAGGQADVLQKGVVTILDIENDTIDTPDKSTPTTTTDTTMIAHFAAHTDAIVHLKFDPTGLLLLTADKRGHDFHLFRIHPHPAGSSSAAVHHLYILHRGDTTAKVQEMSFAPDSRWVTVSTLRGTTHVFPVTPYGGAVGVRTHTTPHVVNRMSRFQRSAGLTTEGRCNSPVVTTSATAAPSVGVETAFNAHFPYHNPRLPPFPHPTVVNPLAQIRQPLFLQNIGSVAVQRTNNTGRQRLSSGSEDNNMAVVVRVSSTFAPPRAWLEKILVQPLEKPSSKTQLKPVESIFVANCHGILVQYDLEPHHSTAIPKERVCDDTPIELSVVAKAQWVLQRQQGDVALPLSEEKIGLLLGGGKSDGGGGRRKERGVVEVEEQQRDDRWLSQVEIVTHAGPHRRLWMGPQFTFKTYTPSGGTLFAAQEIKTIDVGRSKPVNTPSTTTYPILIESGSVSSCEQSPKLLDTYQGNFEETGEVQLKEDLADAMLESPGAKETGGRCLIVGASVANVVNPLGTVVTVHLDDDSATQQQQQTAEEVVIHENCDESLFRPVVASKSLLHYSSDEKSSKNLLIGADDLSVCTRNLKATTEVTCKILGKTEVKSAGNNKRMKNEKNHLDLSSHNKAVKNVVVDSLSLKKPVKMLLAEQQQQQQPQKQVERDFVEKTEIFEPEISLNFEEAAQDLCEELDKKPMKNSSSSEENVIEEKMAAKKARKPKAKLGVRIPTVKIDEQKPKDAEELPKKSWSTIVSTTKPRELIDLDFELKQFEQMAKDVFVDDVFIDAKCSDDEKINSQNETTTESDDSAKIAQQQQNDEQVVDILVDVNSQNKPTKRKSKKKKK